MTDEHERSPSLPPARPPFKGGDGWWGAIIAAVLEEFEGPEEEVERGPGR